MASQVTATQIKRSETLKASLVEKKSVQKLRENDSVTAKPSIIKYPHTRPIPHKDKYAVPDGGRPVEIDDPYQWLEQDSQERSAWLSAQEKHTRSILDHAERKKELEQIIQRAYRYEEVSRRLE